MPYESKVLKTLLKKIEISLDNSNIIDLDSAIDICKDINGINYLSPEILSSIETIVADIMDLQYLSNYIEEGLQEIIIHSPEDITLLYGTESKKEKINIDKQIYRLSLEALAVGSKIKWNYNEPFSSFPSIIHGREARVTFVHSSVTNSSFPICCIRFHSQNILSFNDFGLTPIQESWLIDQIKTKKNILISGATKSGKTTLLKSILNNIPKQEHLITLEDTSELELNRQNTTSLINRDDDKRYDLKQLCKHALRLSPDRIALGEMRSNEAVSFILAMNTGHKGLMSTLHANNAVDAIERVALLFHFYSEYALETDVVMSIICRNIDYVIHLEQQRVTEIIQVFGQEKNKVIFENIYPKQNKESLII